MRGAACVMPAAPFFWLSSISIIEIKGMII